MKPVVKDALAPVHDQSPTPQVEYPITGKKKTMREPENRKMEQQQQNPKEQAWTSFLNLLTNSQSARPQPNPTSNKINLPTSVFGFPKLLTQAS